MAIQILSPQTIAELQQMLRWWRQFLRGGLVDSGSSGQNKFGNRNERWVQTTTCDSSIITGGNVYPSFPSSRFVIQFGDLSFDDTTVGDATPSFVAYDPADYRVALSTTGYYVQGTITRATLHHGRWYLENDHYELLLAKADSSIAPGASGTVSIWQGGADTGANVTAYHTWMEGDNTIEAGTEIVIRWFEDQRKYIILNAECAT